MKRLLLITIMCLFGMFSVNAQETITIGTKSTIAFQFPLHTWWQYSYSQQIYTSNEINHDAANIQKRRIAKLVKQMEDYRAQEETQYELLETKKYTQAVFDRRNAVLREKMEACEKELHLARAALPKNIDYAERIVTLEEAIVALKDPDMSIMEKNNMLRAIVEKINITLADKEAKEETMHLEIFLRL